MIMGLYRLRLAEKGNPSGRKLQTKALLKASEVITLKERMRRRINGLSKGLLESFLIPSVDTYSSHQVDFLHRTVHDYLRSQKLEDLLGQMVCKTFNPRVVLTKSLLE
jgi:hypothetical protein